MNDTNSVGTKRLSQFMRMAVMAGVESAVKVHIDRGDDLNARDIGGMTPLMLSAARDKPVICKMLLNAGADLNLLDRSGKTALEIALDAGAHATAAILNAAITPAPTIPQPETGSYYALKAASKASMKPEPITEADARESHDSHATSSESSTRSEPPTRRPAPPCPAIADPFDDGEFDLAVWEEEDKPTRPEADPTVVDLASAIQIAITVHRPIDSSADWDDIDAYLPDVALPLARADDAEGRVRLRRLLLRALREGSVPALDVQAQSTNEDGSANPEAEAYLAMVINDFGAEVDDRFEYSDADESFEVFVDLEETPEEEEALDEALATIDRAASPRHEPLRIYQREFQRQRLLAAEEEVRLAKDMEAALDVALDALASWPDGIERTLSAGADAIAGLRQLSSIWVGGEPDSEPVSAEGLEAGETAAEDSEDGAEDDGDLRNAEPANDGDAGFADALHRLAALTEAGDVQRATPQEIRQALADLHLNRRFLLELIDAAHGPSPCLAFARAMVGFRQHRDRMTVANLKLAFFHAKRYLYSGEPLDDLAQAGNIGLLKAVDRYDWRRGFRFSTYATWWIRQEIYRYVADKARTIRVPVHIFEKLQRAEHLAKAFETASGREPTLDELAERLEMTSHKLAALTRIAPEPSSIDEETVDGMIDIATRDAYASLDPADVVGEIQLNRAVDQFISALSTKERKEEWILRLRFGIGVAEALTLDEIGTRFGVTRERIRQIEVKAIRKLQDVSRSKPFARTALGVKPVESSLASSTRRSNDDDEHGTAKSVPQPSMRKRQAAPHPPHESSEAVSTPKSSQLEKLLAKAVELGVPINDKRLRAGGVWVEILEPRDKTHRRLIRKLVNFGFAFCPGKGYWK